MSQTTHPNPPEAAVHISFLLDRSGSMCSIRDDVIGGFNQFLREQQSRPGECRMTLVQFDTQAPFEILVDAEQVQSVEALGPERYQPRGGTPLLDALGQLLDHAERRARGRNEDPVVVVFTDGQENASRVHTTPVLFERIAALEANGWSFVFLGANQDAYAEAGRLGFAAGSTSNWDAASPTTAFKQVRRSVGSYREKHPAARRRQSRDFFEGTKEAEQKGDAGTSAQSGKKKLH